MYRLCKAHYLHLMRLLISREFKVKYRQPEIAFGSMDFSGRGYVTLDDLSSSLPVRRLIESGKFDSEDVKVFSQHNSLFQR